MEVEDVPTTNHSEDFTAPCLVEFRRQMDKQQAKENAIRKYLIIFTVTLFVLEAIGIIFLNPFNPHNIDSVVFLLAIIDECLYIIFPISLMLPLWRSLSVKTHKINTVIHWILLVFMGVLLLVQFLREVNDEAKTSATQKKYNYLYYAVCVCKSACLGGMILKVRDFQITKQVQDRIKAKIWKIQFEVMGSDPLEFSEITPTRVPSNEVDDMVLYFTYNSQNDRRRLLLGSQKESGTRFTSLHM